MIQSITGIVFFLGIAWLISEHRGKVIWRTVMVAVVIQILLALLLLKLPFSQGIFLALNQLVLSLQAATQEGTSFVFSYLGGGDLPFEVKAGASSFILAFQALPLVLVMSALSALLFYWQVLPVIVRGFAWLLHRFLRIGGATGVGVAANVFVGMVEAPLLVRPYLQQLTRSQLFVLMTSGMATIAGTMMVLYASILGSVLPDAMGHILTASLISAPAAIAMAVIMVPEVSEADTSDWNVPGQYHSNMDAPPMRRKRCNNQAKPRTITGNTCQ